MRRVALAVCCALTMLMGGRPAARAEEAGKKPDAPPAAAAEVKDPFESLYKGYNPGFGFPREVTEDEKKLSSETTFQTLNLLPESSRAYALVDAAKAKEKEGQFKEALEIYQKVIDEYPQELFRVSEHGIFVPITQYCQLRVLGFPKDALAFYRVKHDSRAKESFELARQRNSLEGLAEIRDKMLCTSFGSPSLTTLGFAALDQGHYLEALEYFQRVWDYFPDSRAQNPALAMSIALCRKMLGMTESSGEGYKLIGYWKLDEGKGAVAADSAPNAMNGKVNNVPAWGPGKVGGAFRCNVTNSVSVERSGFLNIGQSGSDFSVSLWVNWEKGSYPNSLFAKSGHGADEMLRIEITQNTAVRYTVATQSPKWETGTTKGGVGNKKWAHVALVKAGMEMKVFINGKLELRDTLKAPVLKNRAPIGIGGGLEGFVDDVRLYNRALLDREVAAFAGTTARINLTAAPATGNSPLTVDFASPLAGDCLWEFGDGETARGQKVRHTYGLGGEYEPLLTVTDDKGVVSVAQGKVSVKWRASEEDFAKRMSRVLGEAKYEKPATFEQRASEPHASADDYALMPPTVDPLGIMSPVWEQRLPGSRTDVYVYSHPVATKNSVIYRHKNILYAHSILNGELRWQNDLGGRVTWQNWHERQYGQEDVLVQDGMVFTPMYKVGPTLVALDEITGRMKWAYGPMVATTRDESNMRFETSPAGGPMTVYAGYVLDNIEGETHTDSEYGVIAFESATGRIRWQRTVCRMRPGQFSAGFAVRRRNKIRSFFSSPIYREGTIYYCSNAGAVTALDALSGQIKWVMRYPYYLPIHDATRPIGDMRYELPSPMLWYNQKPLLVQDQLYVVPVDASELFCIDRRTGQIIWRKEKGEGIKARRTDGGPAHLLGPTSSGELAIVYSFRNIAQNWAGPDEQGGIHLIDPQTGKTVWESGDSCMRAEQPVLKYNYGDGNIGFWAFGANGWNYTITARPFLTRDDQVIMGGYWYSGWPFWEWSTHMAVVSLRDRTVEGQRRYIGGNLLAACHNSITHAHERLKILEDIPHKDDNTKMYINWLKEIQKDYVPVNDYGPFLPFSRITFDRFGERFEFRLGPRQLSMLYDRPKVKASIAGLSDPEGLLARAELEMGDNNLAEAARLMKQCLATISSEDQDFRALVNQQLYKVYQRLARSSVRSGQKDQELVNCVGMSQTVSTLADEIETLFCLSEAYERKGDYLNAARQAQSIVTTYGHREYVTPSMLAGKPEELMAASQTAIDSGVKIGQGSLYGQELVRGMTLMKQGLPLYFSALSPLRKDLTMRAGELAAGKLVRFRGASAAFKTEFEKQAKAALAGRPAAEQLARLWEFPGTDAAQQVLADLMKATAAELKKPGVALADVAELRKRMWSLADAARISALTIPAEHRAGWLAPADDFTRAPVPAGLQNREASVEEERGTAWLVLERRDELANQPDLMFLGGRVKKKFDNKFVLHCVELGTGKVVWKAQEKRGESWFDEIRLTGKGDEPGFFEAFVYNDVVVVHGLYDVLAFNLGDGKIKWRYQVPFDFEIRETAMSGNLLVLAGQAETVVLCMSTDDPRGEVVWQEKEEGDLYAAPYFHGDRLVAVRKLPFNLTVRYRSTGKLMGKLALPDLSLFEEHPLVENGLRELPIARDGKALAVTDGWYFIMLDVEKMKIEWKRLIEENDVTQSPPMRLELKGDYLAVVKQNFDVKTIYMLNSRTGDILWKTDPKDARSPQPIYSLFMDGDKLYGIKPHPGQAFYFIGLDCKTGKPVCGPHEQKGYGGKPDVRLRPAPNGKTLVVQVRDRQDFELRAFDMASGKPTHEIKVKSAGDFGEHGRASATVQNGRLVLLGKNTLITATGK